MLNRLPEPQRACKEGGPLTLEIPHDNCKPFRSSFAKMLRFKVYLPRFAANCFIPDGLIHVKYMTSLWTSTFKEETGLAQEKLF